ncbi:hypothetical protein C0J52_25652 [Blattella germanica]|nr:hypothetical protein C0J52_25652 [Blattella germanica]
MKSKKETTSNAKVLVPAPQNNLLNSRENFAQTATYRNNVETWWQQISNLLTSRSKSGFRIERMKSKKETTSNAKVILPSPQNN